MLRPMRLLLKIAVVILVLCVTAIVIQRQSIPPTGQLASNHV